MQGDLALKEARDQWSRLTTELERRRRFADSAVRQLRDAGSDASRTMADATREAVDELRNAVEAVLGIHR